MSSREDTRGETTDYSDTDYDDEPPESMSERVLALSEMFPRPIVDFTNYIVDMSAGTVKGVYKFTCNAAWVIFTSAVVLFLPLVFEINRARDIDNEKSQRQPIILGPDGAEYPLNRFY